MEYYSVVESNDLLMMAVAWKDHKGTVLSERRQSPKRVRAVWCHQCDPFDKGGVEDQISG